MKDKEGFRMSRTGGSSLPVRTISVAFCLLLAAGWASASGACSLITPAESFQCETNDDCSSRGSDFAGTICNAGLCVASGATTSGSTTGSGGAGGGTTTGGTGGKGGTGGAPFVNWDLADDQCPYPEANVLTSDQREWSGNVKLNDLTDDIQVCGKLTGVNGPDGVFGVELAAGERVYFDAEFVNAPGTSSPPVDLGVYIMGSCDPTTCLARVDRCKAGFGENLAKESTTLATYYFGFDSVAYDAALYSPELRLSFTFPKCGDGNLEKGETCDDSNKDDGDGCSSGCLAELEYDGAVVPVEVEPNNHRDVANLLKISNNKFRVKGFTGGGCGLDFYLFDLPEGAFPRVKMLADDGKPCPAGTPQITLEFDNRTGEAELGAAKIPALEGDAGVGNFCPEFDENSFASGASGLPADTYMLELKPFDKGDHPQFAYILDIEVVFPAAGTGGAGGGQ